MRVKWKPYQGYDLFGRPKIMSGQIDEDLSVLNKIRSMPKKKPLTYVQAEVLYWSEIAQAILENSTPPPLDPVQTIDWISSQGFHIELTGNEFTIL